MSASPAQVVLVEPEIPWNTGNAGRTCIAAAAQLHLVGPLGFSLEEREVRRAGVHHWREVRPVVWPGWDAFEAALPGLGEPFLFTARDGQALGSFTFPERVVLLFGGESTGLPERIRARYPQRHVHIPLRAVPGISLNVSTAVGIALYELARQRAVAADAAGSTMAHHEENDR